MKGSFKESLLSSLFGTFLATLKLITRPPRRFLRFFSAIIKNRLKRKGKNYYFLNRIRPFSETSINIDHERKFIFIHIPKSAGTSLKNVFGIHGPGDHRTPSEIAHPKTWDQYFSFCVVRNPFEKLVSAYCYHSSPNYTGGLYKVYPDLHDLTFEEYFHRFKNRRPLLPQSMFIKHIFSQKPIDCICRFEEIDSCLESVLNRFNIQKRLPKKNVTPHKHYREYYTESLRQEVEEYYKEDLERFNYSF